MATIVWQAPGAEAISEFARQSSGIYLHATCVETAALMCLVGQYPNDRVPDQQIGDYLQAMVNAWRSADPSVSLEGASNYDDATRWLRGKGCQVDENVIGAPGGWWAELQHGLRDQHCVYLVGVTNAQALPGDEAGVHNHGLAALGIDSDGNIVCGDPDNWRTQAHMPGDPVGAFVTYTQQDLINGQISSLTKVYPAAGGQQAMWTRQADGTGKDSQGHSCGEGVMNYLGSHALTGSDGLMNETFYTGSQAFLPLASEHIITVLHDAAGNWEVGESGASALRDVWNLLAAAKQLLTTANAQVDTLTKQETALAAQVATLQQELAQATVPTQQEQDAVAAVEAIKKALGD